MVKMSILVKLVVAILVLALVPMGVLGYFSFTRITGLETISKENIGGALRTLGEQVIEKKALSAAKDLFQESPRVHVGGFAERLCLSRDSGAESGTDGIHGSS